MSLWNSIKGWMKTPPSKTEESAPAPEQPPGEAAQVVEGESVEELFKKICADNGIRGREANKSGLLAEFVAWYQGAQNRQSILNSLESFKNFSDVAKNKIGDWK